MMVPIKRGSRTPISKQPVWVLTTAHLFSSQLCTAQLVRAFTVNKAVFLVGRYFNAWQDFGKTPQWNHNKSTDKCFRKIIWAASPTLKKLVASTCKQRLSRGKKRKRTPVWIGIVEPHCLASTVPESWRPWKRFPLIQVAHHHCFPGSEQHLLFWLLNGPPANRKGKMKSSVILEKRNTNYMVSDHTSLIGRCYIHCLVLSSELCFRLSR